MTAPATAAAREIVFVFDDLPDWQTLAAAAPEGAEVVVLDGTQDGLAQMAAHLQGRSGVSALHVLSHGAEGALQLGSLHLDSDNLAAHAKALADIGAAMAADGDILLYGCKVAADGAGQPFVQALSQATGADIAASSDLTGAASRGGDWVLETAAGAIETTPLDSSAYSGLLAAFSDNMANAGGNADSFIRILGGVSFTYTFTTEGDGPAAGGGLAYDNVGSGSSAAMTFVSLAPNLGTTERATIKRTDSTAFTFGSIYIDNPPGSQSVTVGGYLGGTLVGSAQIFTTGNTTLNFGNITVDEVRLTSTDFFGLAIDDFSGNTNPPNAPPTATAGSGNTAFTEGANVASTPVVVDNSITVADADNPTLASATVSIGAGFQSGQDILAFTNNPATMGDINAVYVAGTGVMTLTSVSGTATLTEWQAALRSVTYTNSSDTPDTTNRVISFVVNDGTASSTATTKTVSVTAANDAPVDTTSGGSTVFTEGNNTASTPVAVDSAFTVTDDNATLASATVAITGNFQNGEDILAFTNGLGMGNITGSYNAATGVLTLTSAGPTATVVQWQVALRSITYSNSSETPNTSNRTVSFTTNDGTADGNTATKIVTVASTNDSAIATASGGTTAFTEGADVASTPVVVDSGITLSDLDSTTLASATVSITGNLHTAEDLLAFTNVAGTMGNISGSYNAGAGVFTLTSSGATATLAQWQAALRSVTYTNSSDNPNTSNRTVSFVVNDGATNSTAATKTVSVTAANDVPVDTASGGSTAFTQGNPTSTPVAVDSGFTVTDPDNTTLASATVAITGNFQSGEDELAFTNGPGMGNISASYNAVTGVLTLISAGASATVGQWQTALRAVTYTDTAGTVNTSTRTISITTNDGTADGNTVTKAVTVAAFLFPPVATTSGGTTAFTEGANAASTPVVVDSALALSDVDSATLASATVSITGNLQAAEDLLAFTNVAGTMGNISGSYNAGSGVMTLTSAGATATTAQWQAALRSVTYSNSSETPNTSNRTISFSANDGNSSGTASTKVVSVTAVNDVPVDTASGGSTAFTSGNNAPSTPVAVDGGFTVSDLDHTTLASATVAITGNFQTAEDLLAFTNVAGTMGNISASYNAATGVLTLTSAGASATLAQWQTALRSVTYTDTAVTPNTATRTISLTTNDGAANGNTTTKAVTVAATAQTPVATASGGATAFTEGANAASPPVAVDTGITLSDLDSTTFASATVSITGNLQAAEDLLAFTNVAGTMGNISAVYAAGTGVMTLTSAGATATTAQWQAALRSVTYGNSSDTPNTGNRTVSFVVNDGSSNSTASTKAVSVTATNDAPVNTIPAVQTMLTGASLLFSTAGSNLISIGDADAGASTVKVTLTATQGLLTLSGIAGLAFTTGDGTADASMVFTGTVADINNALNGMTFVPTAGFAGPASIEITSDDQGFAGGGGVKTDTDTVAITVNAPSSGGGTPPATTVDGTPVVTEPGPGGSTVITIPVVVPTRPDTPGTPSPLADIPIVTAPDGHPILQVSVPTGVGLQAEGLSSSTSGTAALAELGFRIERVTGNSPELTNAGQVFFATLAPNEPLTVQILKPTTGAGYNPNVPLVITGSASDADGKQAIILDARSLPSGTVIQVDHIDFIAVVGNVRLIGGAGQNAASGDGGAQWIVLGPDDDIIHGGGGNDTVGSEAGDDQVYGDAGDDIVFGGAGNDFLSGGTGSDRLNGGTGFDVAIQEGKKTDYTVTLEGNGIRLTHTASGVSDWLVDVEQVRFATGPSLTVAHSAAEEAAAFLFQKWIGRDLSQAEGAIIQTLTGKTALEVATLFAQVFPQQSAGKTTAQLLEGMADAGAIRVDAIRDVTVTGDAGNNTIIPTLGLARYVDGGAGIDTVVIPATLAQTHIQANGGGTFTLQRMTDGAMLDITSVERVNFNDTKLALDLNGHAGEAAKLLGALGGPAILSNKGLVGEVIRALDSGVSSQALAGIGLQALGAQTPGQVVQLLWTNVMGRAGTQAELQPMVDLMGQGVTGAELAVLAGDLGLNATRIDLVGLAAKGIEFA